MSWTVTIEAMSCQTELAEQVLAQEAQDDGAGELA
jgi:hypothetical protein